jgi:hypothetical protein
MGDAELSPEWIDATVAKVTGTAVTTRRPRLVRRMALAAAALLLGVLSFAGVNVLWPEGRNSSETLDYLTALSILEQPKDTDQRYWSALAITSGRIRRVMADFEQLSNDSSIGPEMASNVADRLAGLRQALDGPVQRRAGATVEVKGLVDQLMQRNLNDTERLKLVDQLYSSALNGILTIREMTAESEKARKGRDHFLRALRSKPASSDNTPSSGATPATSEVPSSTDTPPTSTPSSSGTSARDSL